MKKSAAIKLLLVGCLVLLPLLITPWALDPFEIDKVILARIIGAVAFILFVTKKGTSWIPKLDYKDPGFWYLMLIAWSIIATIFSINPFRSTFGSMLRGGGLLTILCSFGLYVGLRSYGALSEKTKQNIALYATYTSGAIIVLSFFQYLAQSHLYVDVELVTTGAPFQLLRIPGTFGHPLYFGIYLAAMLPMAYYAYKTSKKQIIPIIIAASYIAIYFTRARIAMIAASILAIIFILTKLKKYKKIIITNAVVLGAAILIISPSLQQTIIRPESLFVRMQEWQFATKTNLESPIFGYGFETYDEISISRDRHPHELDDGLADRVHNIWLDTSWNIGFPGLIFLIGLFSAAYYMLRRTKDSWEKMIGLSLLTYLIVMQTSFDFSFTYLLFPFLLSQITPLKQSRDLDRGIMRGFGVVVFALLLSTPAISNAMMFKGIDYLTTGEFEKEAKLYQNAQKINPTWPDISMAEAESWYARSVVEPENIEENKQKAKQLMEKARKRGLPLYYKASFEE